MRLSGFIAITRPVNSIVSGLAAALGYLIATGTIAPPVLILIVIVMLVTAAGNVINDYFDTDIDTVNRPERPIPSGAILKGSARSYAITLFLSGILLSVFTNIICLTIVLINSLLLIVYAWKLKGIPLIGNIAVSYLSASIFLFGGAFAAGGGGLVQNMPIALITFLAMVARELLKDAEDIEGDYAGGARTLPMQIGIRTTNRLALVFAVLAICASLIPGLWWGSRYLVGIGIVDLIIFAAVFRAVSCTTSGCVKLSRATSLLKAGMFASLVIFTLAALFL
jgi:geranylgeranylglycerol-phosphate geranylgeranyltransferase